jgi:protein SCO1
MKIVTRHFVTAVLCLSSIITFAACTGLRENDKRFALSGSEKRYELKGEVVAVDKVNHQVTVAHQDIKNFMPGMTMPFTLKDEWAYEVLVPGDQITSTLIVDGPRSWLQDVVISKESVYASGTNEGDLRAEAKPGDEVPDYGLVNQNGKTIHIHDYRGKALLLTFIYTRCPIPEYCTLMSNNFEEIDQQLQKEPDLYKQTHLLSISIDPEYDTPQVLKSYGAAHTEKYSEETFAHWEFAGGTKDQVKGIAQYFGLRYFQESDQIVHGLRTVIIGPDGRVYKTYRENKWKPEEVLADLKTLLEKKSVP